MDREHLFHTERVHGVAVDLDEPVFIAPHLNGVMEDKIFLQNLPSAVVAHVLNPRPGELDRLVPDAHVPLSAGGCYAVGRGGMRTIPGIRP